MAHVSTGQFTRTTKAIQFVVTVPFDDQPASTIQINYQRKTEIDGEVIWNSVPTVDKTFAEVVAIAPNIVDELTAMADAFNPDAAT